MGTERYDDELWSKLIIAGRKIERGDKHHMSGEQIFQVHDWVDYIGAPQGVVDPFELNKIMEFDLKIAQYKLYDLTGMVMQGRWGEDLIELGNKIAKSYIICVDEINVKNESELYDCINKELYKR